MRNVTCHFVTMEGSVPMESIDCNSVIIGSYKVAPENVAVVEILEKETISPKRY